MVLDKLKVTAVIHGGCEGADMCAAQWATKRGIPAQEFAADWNKYGKAAGPIRNQRMLDEGKPDVVLVFPGGSGTADMTRRALASGYFTLRIDYPRNSVHSTGDV